MKILNIAHRHSVILSKTQNHNIKNVFKFRTHNSLIYTSQSHKNGSTFTIYCKLKISRAILIRRVRTRVYKPRLWCLSWMERRRFLRRRSGGSGRDSGVPVKSPPLSSKKNGLGLLKGLFKRVLAVLSNLPLAISEMFVVPALMALSSTFQSSV